MGEKGAAAAILLICGALFMALGASFFFVKFAESYALLVCLGVGIIGLVLFTVGFVLAVIRFLKYAVKD